MHNEHKVFSEVSDLSSARIRVGSCIGHTHCDEECPVFRHYRRDGICYLVLLQNKTTAAALFPQALTVLWWFPNTN